jgi:hypothetical protein
MTDTASAGVAALRARLVEDSASTISLKGRRVFAHFFALSRISTRRRMV